MCDLVPLCLRNPAVWISHFFPFFQPALGSSAFALFAFFLYYEAQKFLDGVLGVSNRRKF